MAVSLPHALEDFHYGDLQRIGIALPAGIALLAVAYALQLGGIVLAARGSRLGFVLLGALGAIWCIGAIAIHGHDLLFAGPEYRHGLISRALEILIILLGAVSALIGFSIIKAGAPREKARA